MLTPGRLLSHVVLEVTDKQFRTLSDASITTLMQLEIDYVRKAVALKCIRALPKRRVSKLLSDYVSGDQYRYYNVVHWLDFGVSVPKDRVPNALEKVSRAEW